MNFVIFWPQIVWKCIDNYTIPYLSLCNFAHLFSMVWKCACGLDLILQLFFVTFPLCYFSIFRRCDINFTEVRSIFIIYKYVSFYIGDAAYIFSVWPHFLSNRWASIFKFLKTCGNDTKLLRANDLTINWYWKIKSVPRFCACVNVITYHTIT